ncbi:TlpA family protein disulfide reductase [Paraglaciecola marina]|uniref:TlpA family protein disulfide reductase n=1 Tax=Paraglaciecola marina TaxID=2500157 RepID=UPI001060A938|nr:TlpA disulfide reductase family protein [Paraglaciecola marina]
MKLAILLILFTSVGLSKQVNALQVGDLAPNFSLSSMHNENLVKLSDFAGKVVYLDFWASWCGPCRTSFPILSKLYQNYHAQGFEIVSINLDEKPKLAEAFLQQYPVSFEHLSGFGSEVDKTYGVNAMPTGIFIDAKGKVRLIHRGFKPNHKPFIEAVLQKLISEV